MTSLGDPANLTGQAVTYRSGRARVAEVLAERAPLGNVLELACGTGRLFELYAPHADSALLLDASPASIALAQRRVATVAEAPPTELVVDDIFSWDPQGHRFDTVVFTAWLHHVPRSRFDGFWALLDSALAPGGTVVFDYPDATLPPPGRVEVPPEPSEGYTMYAPVDGISIRDHFGRRWRVVHLAWRPAELAVRLARLGFRMEDLGPGLWGNVRWAAATR